ncbi:hypothetical protein INS49_005967 [Diaporthe citri]|uniref:uncharacterized protein n=1 Tax=Diaporthe citri TaxID=83186 RepID=UPI001C7F07F3|nr:uncharacterized protein INS49_005967 [Diaporthe citri]KAG6364366.1 hypothetical protein INS49_005967 [Diaporthe citri]
MVVVPVLTAEEKEHFLNNGWLKIPGAFTKEQAAEVTKDVWTRLGMDPNDKTTWHRVWTNMPHHNSFDARDFAPRAWAAIAELCGGEGRIDPAFRQWRDSLIVNLGSAEREGQPDPPRELPRWHVDGDFFVHYLDSPEQGLLVVPLFTDVPPSGGGTMIYPRGMREVAAHLRDHPEGVSPLMVPRGEPGFKIDFRRDGDLKWFGEVASRGADGDFIEVCGSVGDVYVLHPLMMHASTNNALRHVRIITNPPIALKEPFRFHRADGSEYSLVERATLRMLGKGEGEGLEGWEITHPREALVPERMRIQERWKQEELKRLEEQRKLGGKPGPAAVTA